MAKLTPICLNFLDSIAGIHQTVHQPVPVIGGLNYKSFELIPKGFQNLQNKVKIIGNSLLKYTLEIRVQGSQCRYLLNEDLNQNIVPSGTSFG